jgi:dihydrofolate reductase
MAKVIVDVSVSLDGYVAGPEDGLSAPLGKRGGERIFNWFFTGPPSKFGELFKPRGRNVEVVEEMFARAGAMLTGRRTYEITHGWNGSHPIPGLPIFILTHKPPPADQVPRGKSKLTFVTDGIESAVAKAKAAAGDKDVGIGGASAAQQALAAGLVDEIILHQAPLLLGAGVRLFDNLGDQAIELEPVKTIETPEVTHVHYKVKRR